MTPKVSVPIQRTKDRSDGGFLLIFQVFGEGRGNRSS